MKSFCYFCASLNVAKVALNRIVSPNALRTLCAAVVEVLIGRNGMVRDAKHLTHVITRAQQVNVKTSEIGVDEVLEIESEEKVKTLLLFESVAEVGTTS